MAKNITQIPVSDLLSKAQSVQTGPDIYANHAQLSTTPHEMTIDFYIVHQHIGNPTKHKATHLQRIIIPMTIAKGLSAAIQELTENYEKNMGMLLPDSELKIEDKTEQQD